jgi:hypothetical protein
MGNIQQTPGAVIQIVGSWVVISYDPARQLTLVSVLEGEAEVQPVIDMDTYALGEPIQLKERQFLYTMPGDSSPEIQGLPPRTPLPLEQLGTIVQAADLQPWYDLAWKRAREDGVFPPEAQSQPPFVIQGAGWTLGAMTSQAIMTGVDWENIQETFFPENDAPVTVLLPDMAGLPITDFPYAPDAAWMALAEAGTPGSFSLFLVTLDDANHQGAAEMAIKYLGELGIKTQFHSTSLSDAPEILAELAASGQAVIWLGPEIDDSWRAYAPPPPAEPLQFSPVENESGALTPYEQAIPGQLTVGDTYKAPDVQLMLTFDISAVPAQAQITDAHLDLATFEITGEPFEQLGCLRAYVSKVSEFSAEAYAWEKELGAVARWCSVEELREGGLEEGLIGSIQQNLGEGRYAIRLQFENRTTDDGSTDPDSITTTDDVLLSDFITFEQPVLRLSYTTPE